MSRGLGDVYKRQDSGIILLIGQLAEPLVPETFMNMTQMVIQNSLEALEQMTAIAQEKK